MENTLNGKKVLKLSISRLIIEHDEKNFRSSLPTLDRFDEAKKPSPATVPVNYRPARKREVESGLFFLLFKGTTLFLL
jgi:hypothetical protein